MSKGLIGRKVGMTTVFAEDGTAVPVTVVEAAPNLVFGHRTQERDGYTALQLGFEELDEKKAERRQTRPYQGQFKKKAQKPHRLIKEFRVEAKELNDFAVGSQVTVALFKKGDVVDVIGTSRGMGFAGVVKRHHMKGQARNAASAHEVHRHMGAVGQRKTPGRVFKGKRMPGHMGVQRRTVQNLTVVDVVPESNLLLISGSVPGFDSAVVVVQPARK
ncbi:MAG TPA: 50S ribosomal protein L3 [Myxococcales bacterium]|nr:50S ribosomal protein L3 [Myxococcales bacterium]